MSIEEELEEIHNLLAGVAAQGSTLLEKVKDRRRGAIQSSIHKALCMLNESNTFYSQHGQDRFVSKALDQRRNGVFVDIGGYDGLTGSNTLFFEQFYGWRGLLIEPSIDLIKKARNLRRCPCICSALAGEEGTAEFLEVVSGLQQMSGFLESYDPAILATVRADPRHQEIIHTLQKRTLASILREYGLRQIDYISLDVEGGEMPILRSFPFDEFSISMWSIENNTGTSEIHDLMSHSGYTLVEFVGVDEMYRQTIEINP